MPDWVVCLLISGVAFLIARSLKEPEPPMERKIGTDDYYLINGRWIKRW